MHDVYNAFFENVEQRLGKPVFREHVTLDIVFHVQVVVKSVRHFLRSVAYELCVEVLDPGLVLEFSFYQEGVAVHGHLDGGLDVLVVFFHFVVREVALVVLLVELDASQYVRQWVYDYFSEVHHSDFCLLQRYQQKHLRGINA